MGAELALPKGKAVKRPDREPDHVSKRGVPYWWAPEWVRHSGKSVGRIIPITTMRNGKEDTDLNMLSKDGNMTYIQGSIQQEFKDWHTENAIDYILLGMDPDETDWELEDVT